MLFSCKTDIKLADQLVSHIPDNSVFVASLSPDRLFQKADYEAVKNYGMFKKAFQKLEDSIPVMADILETPSKSGIDFNRDSYFFILNNPDRKRQFLVALLMPMQDATQFQSLISASSKTNIQSSDNAFQFVAPLKGETLIAWNQEKVMLFGFSRGRRDMKAITEVFNMTEDQSLAANPAFVDGFQEQHDIKFFVSSNPIVKNLPPEYLLGPSMAGISADALKDNYTFGSWDFEKGQMDGVVRYELKGELTKHYSLFFKDALTSDFSGLIPSEDLFTVSSYALNLKGVHQGLVEKSVINFVDNFLGQGSLEFKDIAKAFGGDVSLAAYRPNEKLEYLGVTNIKNVEVIRQLLEFGVKTGRLGKVNENLYLSTGSQQNAPSSRLFGWDATNFQILIKDDNLYFATTEALIQKIRTKNFVPLSTSNPSISKLLMDGVGGFYADFQMAPPNNGFDFKELDFMEGSFDREKGTFSIQLFNQKDNSLKSMLQSMEDRHNKTEQRRNNDSEN